MPRDRQQQADGHLGDSVGVAAGCVQHGDAGGGCPVDVDVRGVTARRADGHQRQVEHRPTDRVALADDDRRTLAVDAFGQPLDVVEPERPVLDPRVDHQVDDAAQPLDAGPAEGGGDEGGRAAGRLGRHARASYDAAPTAADAGVRSPSQAAGRRRT
jgi:hypothetical protein